jgi:hypothetical protein
MIRRSLAGLAAVAAAAAVACPARAEPRALPFTYTTDAPEKGELEVEQYVDLTPVKALSADTGNPTWLLMPQFQTEFEYGMSDQLELGLYVVYVPTPSDFTFVPQMPEATGVKQRLKYIFAPPGELPVDVGVYGEVVENDHEVEFEGKILLQRQIGNLRIATNLWAEYELYLGAKARDVVFNPTLGATYALSPLFHLGVEGWMRVELPDPPQHPRPFGLGPAGYVGPAVLFNFGALWWVTGVYARVTDVDHVMQPGEAYGPIWARSVFGFEL